MKTKAKTTRTRAKAKPSARRPAKKARAGGARRRRGR
jgi:hypothetical protein